jgi:formate hydrogenlyase subunit 3/multisubunit Na+/H+ antiporter MnhD subunit
LKLTSSFIITYININFFIYIIVGFLSILTGIFIIFSEKNTKLFFIYSSIGHVGYILIGLGLNTIQGITGAMIYLLIYCISAFIR